MRWGRLGGPGQNRKLELSIFFFFLQVYYSKEVVQKHELWVSSWGYFLPIVQFWEAAHVPRTPSPERISLENIPVPEGGTPLGALNCLEKMCGKKEWDKRTHSDLEEEGSTGEPLGSVPRSLRGPRER